MEELAANPEEAVQPARRRRHSKEFKSEVMRAAMQPHVSIAAVAPPYRLNANLVLGSLGKPSGKTAHKPVIQPIVSCRNCSAATRAAAVWEVDAASALSS